MDRKNDHIIKIIEFEAFPIVSRPNKGVHRVLRSILDKNRPVGRTRRRFDYVSTTSKRRLFFLEIKKKSFEKKAISQYTKSAQRVNQPPM